METPYLWTLCDFHEKKDECTCICHEPNNIIMHVVQNVVIACSRFVVIVMPVLRKINHNFLPAPMLRLRELSLLQAVFPPAVPLPPPIFKPPLLNPDPPPP